jgi:hypothetical protein
VIFEVIVTIPAKYIEQHAAKKLFPVASVRRRMLAQ